MRLKEALEYPGTRARIKSLADIDGLGDFAVIPISSEELPSVEFVSGNYVRLLRDVEQRLEREARERAADLMPLHLVMAMLRNELKPSAYASFRIYGDWILQAVRAFGSAIPFVANADTSRSTVERLKFGLRSYCERAVEAIEARVAECGMLMLRPSTQMTGLMREKRSQRGFGSGVFQPRP
jgi:hypothetical protein